MMMTLSHASDTATAVFESRLQLCRACCCPDMFVWEISHSIRQGAGSAAVLMVLRLMLTDMAPKQGNHNKSESSLE